MITKDPRELLLRPAIPEPTDIQHLQVVTPESAEWEYVGLDVVKLKAGASIELATGADECALVPLSGRCTVDLSGETYDIGGRASIFDGKTSALYVPIDSDYRIEAKTNLEIAICSARASDRYPAKLITEDDTDVEIRGAGNAARQINHIIKPEFPAHRLLVVEVFTPSGNWSSYPPHKHDVSNMPHESDLEEIYYYRFSHPDGFALQRLYTADGSFDEAYVIQDGDLLVMPEGYHAYAVAHGYTGYYLNILAGNESVRTMQPSDDPAHGWVRATWSEEMNEGAKNWSDIDARVNRGAGRRSENEEVN